MAISAWSVSKAVGHGYEEGHGAGDRDVPALFTYGYTNVPATDGFGYGECPIRGRASGAGYDDCTGDGSPQW